MLRVSERQQAETLRREQNTLRNAVVSIEVKIQQAEAQQARIMSEIDRLTEREGTVSILSQLR